MNFISDCLFGCNCGVFPYCCCCSGNYKSSNFGYFSNLLKFQNLNGSKVPYLRVCNQKTKEKKTCIIYFHGNSENLQEIADSLEQLHEMFELPIFAIEYPRYGTYSASCFGISDRIKSDSLQFYNLLKNNYKYEEIVVMGRSIGTGPACYVAAQNRSQNLLLVSPFDSIQNVVNTQTYCLGCLVKNHFNSLECMQRFSQNLFIVHGTNDTVIPYSNSMNLVSHYERLTGKQCQFKSISSGGHDLDTKQHIGKPAQWFLKKNNVI